MDLMPFLNLKLKIKNLKFNSGFTLIELLVVIAIIGILAALATTSYSDSQKKTRDSRRKSDLQAIQKAFELMKQDSAGNYSYPSIASGTSVVLANNNTTPALASTYIKAVPKDPKTDVGYTYAPLTSAPAACTTAGACVTYSLTACLENSKDPQKDGTNSCTSPLVSYTITNL